MLTGFCASQHLSTMNISRRVAQPVTTRTLQPIATKTSPKTFTVPYNYGKQYLSQGVQMTKKGIHKIFETWEHPLYKDFIDPMYGAIEIQHGWLKHKHEQLMHLKDWLTSHRHEHDAEHAATSQDAEMEAMFPVKVPQKTMQRYQFAMKRYEHAYQRFMNHKDNADDIFDYQELQNASNNLYLIMDEIQSIIAEEPVSEPIMRTPTNNDTDVSDLYTSKNFDLKGLIPKHLKAKQLIPDKKPLLPTTKLTQQGPSILAPD